MPTTRPKTLEEFSTPQEALIEFCLPFVADRCVVLDEAHRVAADGPVDTVLGDAALLQSTNLVHAHSHLHAGAGAPHAHPHDPSHHGTISPC